MDIVTILRFVHDHNDKVIGTLVALFLVTSILLLIRSIGEKSENENLAAGGPGVDLKAIEGAMKRVLATQPVSVAAAPVSGSMSSSDARSVESETSSNESSGSSRVSAAEFERLAAEVEAREEKIAVLTRDLEAARASVGEATQSTGAAAADPELQAKLADLQARLAEYEIIEDDIADLSLFKEENAKLKEEVEALKEQLAKAPAEAPAAPVSKVRVENESNLKFEAADRFELDPNDDIMKEFAAAVEEKGGSTLESGLPVDSPELSQLLAEEKSASTPEDDPQAKIDALFASATAEAAPDVTPEVDAQAQIDSMLASAIADVAAEPATPASAASALTPDQEAQAKIDAMFANAAAEAAIEPAAEPVAAQGAESIASPITDDIAHLESGASADSDDSLLGSLDTAKMLSEVESLGDGEAADDVDALAESLDTDRLLAEVQTLEGETPSADAASLSPEPAVQTAATEAAPPAAPVDEEPIDDLLAEFEVESKT
jgi:hypothetical protein